MNITYSIIFRTFKRNDLMNRGVMPWYAMIAHNVLAEAVEASRDTARPDLFDPWRLAPRQNCRLDSFPCEAGLLPCWRQTSVESADVSSSKLKDKALLCCGITRESCSSFTFWSGGERSCDEACKNAAGSSWWWEIDVERKREKCLLFAAVCLQFPRRDIHNTSGNILGTSK